MPNMTKNRAHWRVQVERLFANHGSGQLLLDRRIGYKWELIARTYSQSRESSGYYRAFGLGKSKHWVSLANGYDSTLLRNRMTAHIARKLGMENDPKMLPVVFVVNGERQTLWATGARRPT